MTTVRARRLAAVVGAMLLLPTLGGCATVRELIGSPATRTPPPPVHITEPSYSPAVPQGPKTVADFVGTWSDPKANWTVRFAANGTFSSDYQGVRDFRSGRFEVHNNRLDLIGGDGDVDSGRINGNVVEFRLGTLARVQ